MAVMVLSPRPKKEVYSQTMDTIIQADPEIKARLDSVTLEDVQLTKSIKNVQLRQKQVAQELQEEVKNMDTVKPNLWQRIFSKNVKLKQKD